MPVEIQIEYLARRGLRPTEDPSANRNERVFGLASLWQTAGRFAGVGACGNSSEHPEGMPDISRGLNPLGRVIPPETGNTIPSTLEGSQNTKLDLRATCFES